MHEQVSIQAIIERQDNTEDELEKRVGREEQQHSTEQKNEKKNSETHIPMSDAGGIGVCCSIRGSVLRRKDLEKNPH